MFVSIGNKFCTDRKNSDSCQIRPKTFKNGQRCRINTIHSFLTRVLIEDVLLQGWAPIIIYISRLWPKIISVKSIFTGKVFFMKLLKVLKLTNRVLLMKQLLFLEFGLILVFIIQPFYILEIGLFYLFFCCRW